MTIGIISDTHDNVDHIKKAVELFKKRKVDMVIHCGDIVAPIGVLFFKGLKVYFVKGNCDGDVPLTKEKIEEIKGHWLDEFGEVDYKGKRIFVTHKPDEILIKKAIEANVDYVFHGHTHKQRDEQIGHTRIVNPGGHYPGRGDHSIAFLDVEKDFLEFVDIR